jgi:protein NrfD
MNEEVFISGRNIPHIDPHLSLWEFPISLYLFLGGLSREYYYFQLFYISSIKKMNLKEQPNGRQSLCPFALALGLLALVYDLGNPLYSWRLYTTIRIESPMSWGAWVLLIVTPNVYFVGNDLFERIVSRY